MQKSRENRFEDGKKVQAFIGDYERQYVKDIIKTNVKEVGDKKLLMINPLFVHIPDWQRDIRIKNALEIGVSYNKYLWEVPKIIYDNGKLYVIDGMHRIYGAFKENIPYVVVELLEDVSVEDAIGLFLDQSNVKVKMSQPDCMKAAIKSNKTGYIKMREICRKYNVRVAGDYTDYVPNPVGIFTDIKSAVKMCEKNDGYVLFNRIIRIISKLEWNGNVTGKGGAYGAKVIRAFKKIYEYAIANNIELKNIDKIMINKCKGALYYDENIKNKWDNTVFDFISKIIEKELNIEEFEMKDGRIARRSKIS